MHFLISQRKVHFPGPLGLSLRPGCSKLKTLFNLEQRDDFNLAMINNTIFPGYNYFNLRE
jgi:hypothetical protein